MCDNHKFIIQIIKSTGQYFDWLALYIDYFQEILPIKNFIVFSILKNVKIIFQYSQLIFIFFFLTQNKSFSIYLLQSKLISKNILNIFVNLLKQNGIRLCNALVKEIIRVFYFYLYQKFYANKYFYICLMTILSKCILSMCIV